MSLTNVIYKCPICEALVVKKAGLKIEMQVLEHMIMHMNGLIIGHNNLVKRVEKVERS